MTFMVLDRLNLPVFCTVSASWNASLSRPAVKPVMGSAQTSS